MALVFKKGEFGSPVRRRRSLWPESSCVAGRDEDSSEL